METHNNNRNHGIAVGSLTFCLVVIPDCDLPVSFFGGVLSLVFWIATSQATVFLHVENDEVIVSGDQWLIKLQENKRDAYVDKQRQIKERGFLQVMWPQLVVSLLLTLGWIALLRWYF